MLKVGIDGSCWSNRRGFGRFTRELVGAMAAVNQIDGTRNLSLIVDSQSCCEIEVPAGVELIEVPTLRQPSKAAVAGGRRPLRDLVALGRATARLDFDVFFFPAVYSYFPLPAHIPTLLTLHDAIAELHPGWVFPSRLDRLFWNLKVSFAVRRSRRLLTVSQNAAQAISSVFGATADLIDVIPEGPAPEFRVLKDPARIEEFRQRFGISRREPLILYVGGISPSKNLEGLVDAVAQLTSLGVPDWRLLLVGDVEADGFFACADAVQARIAACGLQDRIQLSGYLEAEDLVTAYNAADVLVLPSFSEGFGLPVIEALACGTPVAVSDRGSLPEVAGEAGVYFDPDEPAAIASAIARVLTDLMLRERLLAAGRRQLALFSWESAATTVLGVLDQLGGVTAACGAPIDTAESRGREAM